ncbi:flagellar biosynthesis anti-sigma factor FlgM [Tetzosporium hominis]|uniref:Negative regulator of flagellin synthesis n=1 Tax=Tetzosporium hominis TaxID=2020506 RepID=A0A264W491_9BACL|nr:flagellar biosynthesis anti-sigma factor FlgM [Tetzosporium hominis]OZS78406.1 flagellar biosynthesis anti-sigma factor FlgM [Tetzosporium hominis]
MNVDKTGNSPHVHTYPKTVKVQQVKPATPGSSEDHVQISNQAQELYNKSAKDAIRQEKVQALKQQIEMGTFQVDSKRIAQDLTDFWLGKQGDNQ